MSRGPRGPRKRNRPIKPQRRLEAPEAYEDDDDIDLRDTPEYKRRQLVVRIGVSILLFAFITTSGLTCIGGALSTPEDKPAQTVSGTPIPQDGLSADILRLREEIQKEPGNIESQASLGTYLLQRAADPMAKAEQAKADLDEAQKLLEAVTQKQPDNFLALQYLGRVYLRQRTPEKAAPTFTKVLELTSRPVDPKAPDKDTQLANQQGVQVQAQVGLADVALASKNYDEALKHLDEALKADPGMGEAYLLRGQVQLKRNQPEQARRDFQLALEVAKNLPPDSAEAQMLLQGAFMNLQALEPKSTATPTPGASGTPAASGTPMASGTPEVVATPGNGTLMLNVTTPSNTTP